jgi:hypothetical protein
MENTMNRQRNIVSVSLMAFLICGMVAGTFSGANAQARHPHYLHALGDLRYARALLALGGENNSTKNSEKSAFHAVEKAMNDLKRAAIDDGKSLDDHPPIDVNVKHKDRLHRALDLLSSARRDLSVQSEDDKPALGWRKTAIHEISDAFRATEMAMNAAKNDR